MTTADEDDDATATRWGGGPYAVVPLVAAGLSAALAAADPTAVAPGPARLLGLFPLSAGVALVGWTALTVARAGATLSPVATPARLVTAGPFASTRNPMYLGVVSAVVGVAALGGSPAAAAYAVALSLAYHVVVVAVEEPKLRAAFGDDYGRYCDRVPRWVPRP